MTKAPPAEKLPRVKIYCDGAVRGNPGGPGGFAAILLGGKKRRDIVGFDPKTTNNRMELRAAIAGLMAMQSPCEVTVVTDSEYMYKGMTAWIDGWKKRDWKGQSGKPVANKDLWQTLDRMSIYHEITWRWVKGHAGHEFNEEADRLANEVLEDNLKLIEEQEGE